MKEKRLYSVFEKKDGKWERLTTLAFKKEAAIRIFQNILLGGSCAGKEMALRVVKE